MTGRIAFAIFTQAVLGGHHQLKSPSTKTCYGFLSNSCTLTRDARISWFLGVLVLLLLGWIAKPGISQVASNQIVDQSFRKQQLVSKNQLLTPESLKGSGPCTRAPAHLVIPSLSMSLLHFMLDPGGAFSTM